MFNERHFEQQPLPGKRRRGCHVQCVFNERHFEQQPLPWVQDTGWVYLGGTILSNNLLPKLPSSALRVTAATCKDYLQVRQEGNQGMKLTQFIVNMQTTRIPTKCWDNHLKNLWNGNCDMNCDTVSR
jgi:hypothetical protein